MEATLLNTEIILGDGTRFTRTSAGIFGGAPTPVQLGEIQGLFSDDTRIALVHRHAGELPEFDIHYFLRES